jgi:glucose-6-phosphate isomerase
MSSGRHLKLDITHLFAESVGEENGITKIDLVQIRNRLKPVFKSFSESRQQGKYPYLEIPYDDELISAVMDTAAEFQGQFENLIIIGIGGSALGFGTCVRALLHPFHNLLKAEQRNDHPRVFIMDNVDPQTFLGLLDVVDVEDSLIVVISKSGATAETAAGMLFVVDALKKQVEEHWKDHLVVITDPQSGELRKLALEWKIPILPIHPGIGGRFSVLTPVGLFPCAMVGIDIGELCAGARAMDARLNSPDPLENPAAAFAGFLTYLDRKKGKHIAVMMPYADGLYAAADWFRQLWAESLGKSTTITGESACVGQTPIKALGTTDQHSQVQLYMEGPADKVFIFLETSWSQEVKLPIEVPKSRTLDYLAGKSLNQLILSEKKATELALTQAHRPNATIIFPETSAYTLGQFFLLWETATVLAGGLLNVNPLDQPGVELGKKLTYALMDRPGYKKQKQEILSRMKKRKRIIL